MNKKTYKLDNVAQMYALKGVNLENIFKIEVTLTQIINPDILQQVVEKCRENFPYIYVKRKAGFFEYSYVENNCAFMVVNESKSNYKVDKNGYLFKISYCENKITFYFFHGLCDAIGAIEYIKYLLIMYFRIQSNSAIEVREYPEVRFWKDEYKFNSIKVNEKHEKLHEGHHVKSKLLKKDLALQVTSKAFDTKKLVQLAKKYNATLTEYLTSLLIFSIGKDNIKKPINICVAVNLRRFFSTKTLRNFSLFFYVTMPVFKIRDDFINVLIETKQQFDKKLIKEKLQRDFSRNVAYINKIFVKWCPLFIKKVLVKLGYYLYGEKINTCTISNLGELKLVEELNKYVSKFEFNLSCGKIKTNSLAIVSYKNKTVISFSRSICENDFEKKFFDYLKSEVDNVKNNKE